jgi:hypothetical protein
MGAQMDAHERWSLDAENGMLRLLRFMCLCRNCHLGTHWGLANSLGYGSDIREHIIQVTGWTEDAFRAHLNEQSSKSTNMRATAVDVSIIERLFPLRDPRDNIAKRERQLEKELDARSLQIDGAREDLAIPLRKGYAAFLVESDLEMLDAYPLTDCGTYPYGAKAPDLLHGKPSLPLKAFIAAYNNPVVVQSEEAALQEAADGSIPKRLVLAFKFEAKPDFITECLRKGLIFSLA